MAFEIGERVINPWTGPGTVVGPLERPYESSNPEENDRTPYQKVRFDNPILGERLHIISNLNPYDEPKPKVRKSKCLNPKTSDYATVHSDFISFLRAHATIRVQLPPSRESQFLSRYERITGQSVDREGGCYSLIEESSKWGIAVTVLFPKCGIKFVPEGLKTFPSSFSNLEVWAICNQKFAWELFSIGFRLGSVHGEAPAQKAGGDEKEN